MALIAVLCPLSLAADEGATSVTLEIQDSATCATPYCSLGRWVFFEAEYLYWWTVGADLPPLVTTSPAGTPIQNAGVLGEPATNVLFGGESTSSGPRSGLKLRSGILLDDYGDWWFIGQWFGLPSDTTHFLATSNDYSTLARPFFDPAINLPNAELISFPGLLAGGVSVDASNNLWGAGALLQKNLLCCQWEGTQAGYRVDLVAGYRFLKLSDRVRIYEQLSTVNPQGPLLVGTRFDIADQYRSRSYFHGLELGIRGELARSRYYASARCSVAIGGSYQRLDVDGITTVTVPGADPVTFRGGLLANGAVLGSHTDQEFAVVPQVELKIGRQLTDHVRCSVGYSFLYWSQVVRAGEQIQTTVDSSQLPSAASAPVSHREQPLYSSGFWAQGLTASLEWQY